MSNLTKVLILLGIGLFLAAASIWFIGGKKKDYDARATIKARPYQLFPYLVEPEQKQRWMTGLIEESIEIPVTEESNPSEAEELAVKENTNLISVFDIDGVQVRFDGQVIRFASNDVAAFRYRSDEMKRTAFFRLKAKGDETQLEYQRIVQLSGMSRFLSVFKDDNNLQEISDEIKRLTELVEGEVDNSIPDPNAKLQPVELQPANNDNQSGSSSRQSQTGGADAGQGSDSISDSSNENSAEPASQGSSTDGS